MMVDVLAPDRRMGPMSALILSICCVVGCPLTMGAMWLMTRDRDGARIEREVRRLNAEADARRALMTAHPLIADATGAPGSTRSPSPPVVSHWPARGARRGGVHTVHRAAEPTLRAERGCQLSTADGRRTDSDTPGETGNQNTP